MTLAPSISSPPIRAMPPVRITVGQYHRMIETGILKTDARIELLDGELVRKNRSAAGEDPMTIGTGHVTGVDLLIALNPKLKRLGCYMRIQSPVTLPPHSEPEPDGAIVRGIVGT